MDEPYVWETRVNDDGRRVYAMKVKGYRIAVGAVIDYSPGTPPYKINMVYPMTTEWEFDLEAAKERVVSLFFLWLMNRK